MSARPSSRWFKGVSLVIRVAVGLGVLAVGIGVAATLVATRPVPPRTTRGTPVLQVRAMTAVLADVHRSWEGYGSARAMVSAQIPAQVSATVVHRPASIEPGLVVQAPRAPMVLPDDRGIRAEVLLSALLDWAGAGVVLRLDPTDFASRLNSSIDQAEATRAQLAALDIQDARTRETLALAVEERQIQERELERAITAEARGGGNTTEVERRRASLLLARRLETQLLGELEQIEPRRSELSARLRDQSAMVDVARQNLARTVIVSPIAGVLQDVMAREGEWLQAGTAAARVVDFSRMEVPLRVPAEAAGVIAVGDQAELSADTRGGARWQGRVIRVAPEVDPQTRTVTAFVEVDQNPEGQGILRPGQFVVGRITTSTTTPVLLVPRRVVVDDRIYVLDRAADPAQDGASDEHAVRSIGVTPMFTLVAQRPDLDPVEDQWCAVRPGGQLVPGDLVIISNLDDLRDGLLVRAVTQSSQTHAGSVP